MDDEPQVLESIKRAFRKVSEIAVFTTADPKETLDIVRFEQIYLLITDQKMPGLQGTELLRKAKAMAPHMELGILTAYADVDLAQVSINEIKVRYLFSKPFHNRNLVEKVLDAIANVDQQIKRYREQESVKLRRDELEKENRKLIDFAAEKQLEDDVLKNSYKALIRIGKTLNRERDERHILKLVLSTAIETTGADAGTIYTIDEDAEEKQQLRIDYSYSFSTDVPLEDETLLVNLNSIVGYVASTGKILNIPDVHDLPASVPFSFNDYFERKTGYVTCSMLVLPMIDHNDAIVGVVELVNKKKDIDDRLEKKSDINKRVIPFDAESQVFVETLAAMAGILLKRNRSLWRSEKLLGDLIKTLVETIESRDPATVGHSDRVTQKAASIAKRINEKREGIFSTTMLDEETRSSLHYAALLHEMGKIFIDPDVFFKDKKLYPEQMAHLMLKLDYLYRYQELIYTEQKLQLMNSRNGFRRDHLIKEVEKEESEQLLKIQEIRKELEDLNEPTLYRVGHEEKIESIKRELKTFKVLNLQNNHFDILTDKEKFALSIKQGSLTAEEKRSYDNRVQYSYDFLQRIEWPKPYSLVPSIVLKLHEKTLDAKGSYDLKTDPVALCANIIAAADIMDELTSVRRPHKKVMNRNEAALAIQFKASKQAIDQDIVDLLLQEEE
ncbi:MAG: response regulator [Spirochaetales bacterium]|nr:response regulator [Spirochaetales bacterium]MCF7938294.1 response regulator [Spirochaetales bacterium]